MNDIGRYGFFTTFFASIFLSACVLSVANISHFPRCANEMDFDKYSTDLNKHKTGFWTFRTSYEYYIERQKAVKEKSLESIIEKPLREKSFLIDSSGIDSGCVIAVRGLRPLEYGAVTGVYYKMSGVKLQIYIKTEITQDFSGGPANNLAKKIGVMIEDELNKLL